ncbi:MAG: T9SS type A sorting domain-containing protein [Bacteroidia bacterium]|nr:T9SS type A sorting domain-containing protein [Bacteroidia bacterium]
MKTKISIILFLFFVASLTQGQSIIRSSINCFGNSISVDNILFRQSAGQPSNTDYFVNGQLLRQGFQQPINLTVQSFTKNNISIVLYPNPATTETKLIINGNLSNYEIVISAITGKDLMKIQSDKSENNINCSTLPIGLYIVSIVKGNELYAATKLIITK